MLQIPRLLARVASRGKEVTDFAIISSMLSVVSSYQDATDFATFSLTLFVASALQGYCRFRDF